MSRYNPTERKGVNAVESIVLDELGWIFREQPIADMGIDAHIELVDKNGNPTGKLVGLQIKTGRSHFKEKGDKLIFYGETKHLNYWLRHSLPVILIAHLPESGETFWVQVSESTITRTTKHWKISISKAAKFGGHSSTALIKLSEGNPAQQKLRELAFHESMMRHIESGGKVSVSFEDMINKSLGRTPVRVFLIDDEGFEFLDQEWFQLYRGGTRIKALAERLFPWAEAGIDQEIYDLHEDIDPIWDDDPPSRASTSPDGVYPYSEMYGEVEYYQLELELNEIGKAFLILSDYMMDGYPYRY